jgi:hypothetical protein
MCMVMPCDPEIKNTWGAMMRWYKMRASYGYIVQMMMITESVSSRVRVMMRVDQGQDPIMDFVLDEEGSLAVQAGRSVTPCSVLPPEELLHLRLSLVQRTVRVGQEA